KGPKGVVVVVIVVVIGVGVGLGAVKVSLKQQAPAQSMHVPLHVSSKSALGNSCTLHVIGHDPKWTLRNISVLEMGMCGGGKGAWTQMRVREGHGWCLTPSTKVACNC